MIIDTSYEKHGDNYTPISLVPLPFKSIRRPFPSNVPHVFENMGTIYEIPRTFSHLQCFNCKDFDHISFKCPSRALVIEERKHIIDEQLEDQVYKPKLEKFDD